MGQGFKRPPDHDVTVDEDGGAVGSPVGAQVLQGVKDVELVSPGRRPTEPGVEGVRDRGPLDRKLVHQTPQHVSDAPVESVYANVGEDDEASARSLPTCRGHAHDETP